MAADGRVLAHDDVARWARRPPPWIVRVAAPLTLFFALTNVLLSPSGDSRLPEGVPTTDPANVTYAAVQGIVVGSMVASLFVPSLALWSGAAAAVVLALTPLEPLNGTWWTLAGLLIAVGLVDSVPLARQVAISRSWSRDGVVTGPLLAGSRANQRLFRLRPFRLVVIVLISIGAAALAVDYVRNASATVAFHDRARTLSGVVVSVPPDELSAMVRLDDRVVEVGIVSWTWLPEVGDEVEVALDPTSGRVEFTDDPYDPTSGLFGAVGGLVAATLLLVAEQRRRRATRRLITLGGPALIVLATWSDRDGGVALTPPDLGGWPFAVLPRLASADDRAREGSSSEVADEVGAASDGAAAPASANDDRREMSEAIQAPDHMLAHHRWRRTAVTVVGLRRDGQPAAVHAAGGHWLVTESPVRRPRRRHRDMFWTQPEFNAQLTPAPADARSGHDKPSSSVESRIAFGSPTDYGSPTQVTDPRLLAHPLRARGPAQVVFSIIGVLSGVAAVGLAVDALTQGDVGGTAMAVATAVLLIAGAWRLNQVGIRADCDGVTVVRFLRSYSIPWPSLGTIDIGAAPGVYEGDVRTLHFDMGGRDIVSTAPTGHEPPGGKLDALRAKILAMQRAAILAAASDDGADDAKPNLDTDAGPGSTEHSRERGVPDVQLSGED